MEGKKTQAMEREEFQKRLSELGAFAKEKGNCLKIEEVREFFQDMEISEEQYELLFAYLVSLQVKVEGYVPGRKEEKAEIPLSQEEEAFLRNYREELKYLEPLSEDEIQRLCQEVEETGGSLAKAKLTEQLLPDVLALADEFRGRGLLLGDLVQEGNIGLMLALETLGIRPDGMTARDYLHGEIRAAITQAIEDDRTEKDAGNLLADRLNHLSDSIRKLSDDLERQVSIEELSAYMDMPVEEIEDLLKLAGEGGGSDENTEEGQK